MGSALSDVLRKVIAPLVQQDQGELFVGRLDAETVELHLRGRYSGCPGNALAIQRVIEPALRAAAPRADIRISSGELLPDGVAQWHMGAEPDEESQTG